jgi:hypothetical protein
LKRTRSAAVNARSTCCWTQRGDAAAEVERVLADDPGCVFGHCLRAALIVRAESAASRSALTASIAAIEAACPDPNDQARRHALAARAWLNGDSAAAATLYGAILTDWPHDILALAVAHALDFHLGRRRVMRDRIAKVLPQWTAAVPGYASVLAITLLPSKKMDSTVAPKKSHGARWHSTPSIPAPFMLSRM